MGPSCFPPLVLLICGTLLFTACFAVQQTMAFQLEGGLNVEKSTVAPVSSKSKIRYLRAARALNGSPEEAIGVNKTTSATESKKEKFERNRNYFYSFITIDGGGLKGRIAVEVLLYFESLLTYLVNTTREWDVEESQETPVLLADYVKAFSGVNSGAWIASYLASKCGNLKCKHVLQSRDVVDEFPHVIAGSVEGLVVLFEMFSNRIYPSLSPHSRIERARSWWTRRCIPGVSCPSYLSSGYVEVVGQFMGDEPMWNLSSTLILPMYDLKRRTVVTLAYNSSSIPSEKKISTFVFEGQDKPLDPWVQREEVKGFKYYDNRTYSLLDAVVAAGSRVTQHEAHKFSALNEPSFELLCQDSSLLFNNPSVVGIASLMYLKAVEPMTFWNISLLSIGTGLVDGSLADRAKDGTLQWSVFSADFYGVVIHGGSELVQTQVDTFFYLVLGTEFTELYPYECHRGQYLRIQSTASEGTPAGEALMSTDNAMYLSVYKTIGRQTAERYLQALYDFARVFVLGIERERYQFSKHLFLSNFEETADLVKKLDSGS